MAAAKATAKKSDKTKKKGIVPGAKKIRMQMLPGFTRQLGAMLGAGMPIIACLQAMEEQTDDKHFKKVISEVAAAIENGQTLADALRQYPTVFEDLYCNMIAGGERSGELSETMNRLSGFLESSAKLRSKVKSALMYPVVVLIMALIITVGLILFVVPVFGNMFSDFGGAMPKPTQILLDTSDFMRGNFLLVFGGVGGLVMAFRGWKKSPAGALTWDRFMLKAPVFGKLNRYVVSARFASMLSQMTRCGVPILGALQIVAGSTGNRVAGRIVDKASEAVEKGEPLSSAMVDQNVFPLGMVRMLQAGEKTGEINEMMDNIAKFYEDEIETMLAGLTSLLEPLLMAFLGILIGGLVLSMFLPIFKMGEVVGGG